MYSFEFNKHLGATISIWVVVFLAPPKNTTTAGLLRTPARLCGRLQADPKWFRSSIIESEGIEIIGFNPTQRKTPPNHTCQPSERQWPCGTDKIFAVKGCEICTSQKPFNSIVFGKAILVEFVCLSYPVSTQKEWPSYRFRRKRWKAQPKCAKIGR